MPKLPKLPRLPKVKKTPVDIPSIARALGQSVDEAAARAGAHRMVGGLSEDPQVASYLDLVRKNLPPRPPGDVVSQADLMQEAMAIPGWRGAAPEEQLKNAMQVLRKYVTDQGSKLSLGEIPLEPGTFTRGAYRRGKLNPETESDIPASERMPVISPGALGREVGEGSRVYAAPGEDPITTLAKGLKEKELEAVRHWISPDMYPRPKTSQKYIELAVKKAKELLGIDVTPTGRRGMAPEPEISLPTPRPSEVHGPVQPSLPGMRYRSRPMAVPKQTQEYRNPSDIMPWEEGYVPPVAGVEQLELPMEMPELLRSFMRNVLPKFRQSAITPPRGRDITGYETIRRREFE